MSHQNNPPDQAHSVCSTLGDILTPGVLGVPAGSTMRAALERMREARISSVVALRRGRPVGILTERGVIAAMVRHGKELLARKVSDVMSSPVLTAPSHMPIPEAFSMLLEKGIRHLVVVDAAGRALGMVTQTNMVRNLGVEYFVEVKRIEAIMVREVATLDTGESLAAALELMVRGPYSCVLALRDGEAAGIVTERDMVGFLARGVDLSGVILERVMSSPVVTAHRDTPVHQAAALMSERGIRRLVVVDSDGRLAGMLTQSDIVKGMEARYVEMLKDVIREKDHLLRQAVAEAARKTVYLDTILNTSVDLGIAATDGETIAFVNQAALSLLGLDENQAIGQDVEVFHRCLGVPQSRMRKAVSQVRKGGVHHFRATVSPNGSERFLDARVSGIRDAQGGVTGYVVMLRDVTERRLAEETIRRMAYHDALTGLPNRFLVADRLEQGLNQAKRRGCLLAVMLLDLDGFKVVNDNLGHSTGDLLLKQVAGRIAGLLRRSDTVGRMGGDEFLVVLPEVKTPEGVAAVASKMLRAVGQPVELQGAQARVSASIGLALYPWDGATGEALIQRADAAMYEAKAAGRGTYRFAGKAARELDLNHP
ncbi:putative signaling protein [Fundidesulfovibrio magnetotacticus]|uniref:Putative signaling protein n=1 Tax=Fundidesulfovibrio magnetotacticus TaxID=2730080 RepID=A0A6V8LZ43_9BACT|nr:diguanylate cyclase [Fundidesulfovibrio magnetotacticus]GFK95056.1 putative signaling protein [Fundidesulfovibrio magnetotacticus]